MPVSRQDWDTLLAMPAPVPAPRARALKVKLTTAQQNDVNNAMWDAVDAGDLERVQRAVDMGASIARRRDGQPALWRAVQDGKWDIAEFLREEGADIGNATSQGLTLWNAIERRDDVSEAERLVGWGVPSLLAGPTFCTGHQLLDWWRLRHPVEAKEHLLLHDHTVTRWVKASLQGSEDMRQFVNKSLGIDAGVPESLAKKKMTVCQRVWEDILRADNVEVARRAIACGWGPPIREQATKETWDDWGRTTEWSFFNLGGFKILDWWLQVPKMRERLLETSRNQAGHSWVMIARKAGVERLDRIAKLGVDVAGYRDARGNTLAHFLFDQIKPSKAMAEWWIKNHPETLTVANADGHTPVTPTSTNAKFASYVQNELLKRQVTKAPKPTALAPGRGRM